MRRALLFAFTFAHGLGGISAPSNAAIELTESHDMRTTSRSFTHDLNRLPKGRAMVTQAEDKPQPEAICTAVDVAKIAVANTHGEVRRQLTLVVATCCETFGVNEDCISYYTRRQLGLSRRCQPCVLDLARCVRAWCWMYCWKKDARTGFRRPTCFSCISSHCENGFRRCALPAWMIEVDEELEQEEQEEPPAVPAPQDGGRPVTPDVPSFGLETRLQRSPILRGRVLGSQSAPPQPPVFVWPWMQPKTSEHPPTANVWQIFRWPWAQAKADSQPPAAEQGSGTPMGEPEAPSDPAGPSGTEPTVTPDVEEHGAPDAPNDPVDQLTTTSDPANPSPADVPKS